MNIYLAMHSNQSQEIYELVSKTITQNGHTLLKENTKIRTVEQAERITDQIRKADFLISDVSVRNISIIYQLGFAWVLRKPLVLLCVNNSYIPPEISQDHAIVYDESRLDSTLIKPLNNFLSNKDLQNFIKGDRINIETVEKAKTVFVCYSHKDIDYLERLKVHLKPFERQGKIDLWSDKKIHSGAKWDVTIKEALNKAAVAILLVSADFLASDFIVDNELPPILRSAEEKGTLVLPIILKPCYLKNHILAEIQSVNVLSKPLSKMNENDREEVFVEMAERIGSLL